jgi:hypothetical protein
MLCVLAGSTNCVLSSYGSFPQCRHGAKSKSQETPKTRQRCFKLSANLGKLLNTQLKAERQTRLADGAHQRNSAESGNDGIQAS